jgi:uncharacterized NAD(P)/FAD-binding protein YdhS
MTAPGNVNGEAPIVAIVGGGCAGTLVAANLLRRSGRPLRIVIVERSGCFGAGVAYSTQDPRHLLNVRAERMSAFADAPSDFAEWAARRLGAIEPASYLPRGIYGEYLRSVLASCRAQASRDRTLELITGEVTALRRRSARIELSLAAASPILCDAVVLASGPPEGAPLEQVPQDPRVVATPWAPGALAASASKGLTLVLGSGLSGVDVMLSLGRGRGRLLALSRSGQLPRVQLAGLRTPAPAPAPVPAQVTLNELERTLGEHARRMRAEGYDWRDVLDGLRPLTPRLWAALGSAQQRRFLRYRRRAWEIRRHRMAPASGARLAELIGGGRARLHAGRVLSARALAGGIDVDVVPARSQLVRTLRCQRVVICTGAGLDIRRSRNPLLVSLLESGVASADQLALGLRTDSDGALIDAHGRADGRLLTLGALRRGELWETTAVEEIRAQAEHLVRPIERALGGSVGESPPRSSPPRQPADATSRPLAASGLGTPFSA